MVSLPTMILGFARYSRADAFKVLRKEKPLMGCMVAGAILGAVLGVVLLLSAIKTFRHTRIEETGHADR